MDIQEIIGRYIGIYTTAKRYHWKVTSPLFCADHDLFDEVADTFDLSIIDSLVEITYMYYNRDRLAEVDTLYDNFVAYKGKVFLNSNSVEAGTEMAMELKRLCEELLNGINSIDNVARELNVILDDMSSKISHALVLLTGRTAFTVE